MIFTIEGRALIRQFDCEKLRIEPWGENMKPYITDIMREAHEKGTPVIRPLFYDFPNDKNCIDYDAPLEIIPIFFRDEAKRI